MISATIEELYSGAWVADTVDVVAPTGTFTTADGQTWVGTVFSSAQDGGRYYARIVGGKGNLGKALPDRWYNGTSLIDKIGGDAVTEAGETLGSATLGTRVDSWQRAAGTLGQALAHIVAIVGGVWWVGRDGNVNLAASRPASVIAPQTVSVKSRDVDGSLVVDPFPTAALTLGATWNGQEVRHIRWVQTSNSYTASLAFKDLDSPILTWDYLRTYSAKVDKQNEDGSLDLIVDERFSVTSVKWLSGLPGKVVINGGDEVTIGWHGGDPRYPYAVGLVMTDGGKAVARVDDTVDAGTLVIPTTLAGVVGPVTFKITYVPPGPTHDADVAQALLTMVAFAPVKVDLKGVITSGQVRVLI